MLAAAARQLLLALQQIKRREQQRHGLHANQTWSRHKGHCYCYQHCKSVKGLCLHACRHALELTPVSAAIAFPGDHP